MGSRNPAGPVLAPGKEVRTSVLQPQGTEFSHQPNECGTASRRLQAGSQPSQQLEIRVETLNRAPSHAVFVFLTHRTVSYQVGAVSSSWSSAVVETQAP